MILNLKKIIKNNYNQSYLLKKILTIFKDEMPIILTF